MDAALDQFMHSLSTPAFRAMERLQQRGALPKGRFKGFTSLADLNGITSVELKTVTNSADFTVREITDKLRAAGVEVQW